ncbi:hypothetical protein JCM11251_003175 [Rhodosporidiobolus azoricus]
MPTQGSPPLRETPATAATEQDDLASSLHSLNLAASSSAAQHSAQGEAHIREHVQASAVTGVAASVPEPALPTLVLSAPTSRNTPRTAVLFQPACARHRYVRNSDIGTIVERPERLRAVKTGVAAAWSRLEERDGGAKWQPLDDEDGEGDDELGGLMERLTLAGKGKGDVKGKGKAKEVVGGAFDILETTANLPLSSPALRLIHSSTLSAADPAINSPWFSPLPSTSSSALADSSHPAVSTPSTPSRQSRAISSSPTKSSNFTSTSSSTNPPLPWPVQLQHLCRRSSTALLTQPFSEIPPSLPQGDLYLCEESEQAIFGALGAVCEGVDKVVQGDHDRTFVAIRPPGHHCGEASPSGFCFVNNAAVAAAHAYVSHGINRVVILDIDLHHGNGTQEIVYRINAEANHILAERAQRTKTLTSSPRKASPKKGPPPAEPELEPLRIFYGSMHDIWSYPCEDGDPSLVQAASLSLSGGHGQWISNVHLESYVDEEEFHRVIHPKYREGLLGRAEEFCRKTGGSDGETQGEKTLVIVSAGFDASHHEYPSMSRHARHVPTSFYRRFARDVVAFANGFCGGKVLSVLEGGYSDRALASAAAAFLTGLSARSDGREVEAEKGTRAEEENEWWAESNLVKLEKACALARPRRGGAGGVSALLPHQAATGLHGADPSKKDTAWLTRAVEIFARIEGVAPLPDSSASAAVGASSRSRTTSVAKEDDAPAGPRQLRERKLRHNYAGLDDGSTPVPSPIRGAAAAGARRAVSAAAAPSLREKKESGLPQPLPALPPSIPLVNPMPPPRSTQALEGAPTAEAQTEPVKPSIKITWKAGGFMGEPRM